MKTKKNKDSDSKEVSKKPSKEKRIIEWKWIITISITAFIISMFFSFIGETIIPNVYLVFSVIFLFLFILIGIVFDIVGISVTVADIKVFNSMASKRVRGASLAVKFIKNSNKVSSFLNDVIGDICGVLSGSIGVSIAYVVSEKFNIPLLYITLITTAIVSTLTIGGKAIGKSVAINRCNEILYSFVKIISLFYKG